MTLSVLRRRLIYMRLRGLILSPLAVAGSGGGGAVAGLPDNDTSASEFLILFI